MNTNAFLTCLVYFGISTGASVALEGIYAFNSGTTGIIYNQLYPTGSHFSSGQIVSSVTPLINVTNNGFSGNFFSGANVFRIGYQHTGNFSILLDIESSGCLKRTTSLGKDAVLLSTVNSSVGFASGFAITINDANHLVFKTLNKSYTLNKELSLHDFIYVGVAEKQYVNFGIYNVAENQFYNKSVVMSTGIFNTNDLYLGGFLNPDATNYANFYGKINQAVLFDDTVKDSDFTVCADCTFATGFIKGTDTFTSSGLMITGVQYSGIQQNVITSTFQTTGLVGRSDGSTVSIILVSGVTGSIQTGEVALPLSTNVAITGSRDNYTFLYDNAYLASFSPYQIQFDLSLTSGDVLEIYTYPRKNNNIGKRPNGVKYPIDTGFLQLIGNGLAETSGIDYYLVRNQISGFFLEDVLSYDVLPQPTQIIDYSGYWQTSRIPLSGGGYFPSTSQFYENTGVADFSGKVIVTGVSGVCVSNSNYPNFGYDLYLNGQKLVSGLQYNVSGSGVSGFVVLMSGLNLPSFIATPLYSPTGGLPTGVDMNSIDDSELTFMPQYSGFSRSLTFLTGTSGTITNFTGFSEQIWVNGIRQVNGLDYSKYVPCVFATGATDLPEFADTLYNSDNDTIGLWGFEYPPAIVALGNNSGGAVPASWLLNCDPLSLGSYQSGNFVEVWFQLDSGPYQIIGNIPTSGAIGFPYTGGVAHGTGTFKVRYRNNNIIGQFMVSNSTIV